MRTRTFAFTVLAIGALGYAASMTAAPGQTTAPAPSAAGESFKVDPVHSAIIFGIKHLGASYFYGRINGPEGTFHFNPDDVSACSFDIKAKAQNIDTDNGMRDSDLKSENFFSAKQFPEISFKSTTVKKQGKDTYQVAGNLALHGVTKPITIDLEHVGTKDHPKFGHRCGFRTTFTIKRSDFGMTFMLPDDLGDEVMLIIGFEGK